MLGILVPEVEGTVTTGSAEGSVDGVEADGVDGVDVADVAVVGWGFTVALKGEVGGGIFLLDVLDGTTALNTANGKSGSISKAADYPRLPLQGGLHSLVEFGWLVKVDDVDVAISSADDQQLVLNIHCVHALLAINIGDGGLLPQIPIFDSFVP